MAATGFSHQHQRPTWIPLTLLLLTLTGCSVVPERTDYQARIDQEQNTVAPWQQISEMQPASALTDLLDSPSMQALIEQARINHPGPQQTLLTLQIREAQLRQVRG
ncbi:MAG: hypothetical protein JJU48_04380 [Methylophaga sp.]|nr:hypothetical protein [Methylophaga sp.]